MDGGKYLNRRMKQMKKSDAPMAAAIRLRILILIFAVGIGWLSCDQGIKFLVNQSSYTTR